MCAFQQSPYRDEIIHRLCQGVPAAELARIYPKPTVYYLKKQLDEGAIPMETPEQLSVDSPQSNPLTPPEIPLPAHSSPPARRVATRATRNTVSGTSVGGIVHKIPETNLESLLPGSESLPIDPLNAVRGVLEIKSRHKVLEMPTPDLLYPAMTISIAEWGWPPMMPQDFIDTILSKFLKASDIEYNTYIKRSQMEEILKCAMLGGYKPPGNGNNNGNHDETAEVMPPDETVSDNKMVNTDNNTVNNKEGEQNDSNAGSPRPTGEESGNRSESGGSSENKIGGNNGTERGNGGVPI